MNVLGICGSLRRQSYNAALLDAFAATLPVPAVFSTARIDDIPLYNDDIRIEGAFPASVARFRAAVATADAVVFATPEYNYSIPGVLKNALDWASRAPDQPFAGKPVAIMSASTSLLGGARVQYHLRQVLVFLDAHPINKPEVFVAKAHEKFSGAELTDPVTRSLLADLATALVHWTGRLSAP